MNKAELIKYIHSDIFEKIIIGKSAYEIEDMLNFPIEKITTEEYVFIIRRSFFGLFRQRLHLYFHKGSVRDYFIGW